MGDELTETIQAPPSGVGSVKDSVYVVKKKERLWLDSDTSDTNEVVWGVFSSYQKAWTAITGLAFRYDNGRSPVQVDATDSGPGVAHPFTRDGETFELPGAMRSATRYKWRILEFALDEIGSAYADFDLTTDAEYAEAHDLERVFRDARHVLDTIETARGWCDRDGDYPGTISLSRGMLDTWIHPLRRLVGLFVKDANDA